jgi:hypothetical protein
MIIEKHPYEHIKELDFKEFYMYEDNIEELQNKDLKKYIDSVIEKDKYNRKLKELKEELRQKISEIKKTHKYKYIKSLNLDDFYKNEYFIENLQDKNLEEYIEKKITRDMRKRKLEEALNKYNLRIREDSKICNAYIKGDLEEVKLMTDKIKSFDDIVNTVIEMNFLYTKTNYAHRINRKYRYNYEDSESDSYEYYYDYNLIEKTKEKVLIDYYTNNKNNKQKMEDVPEFLREKMKILSDEFFKQKIETLNKKNKKK